MVITTSAPSQRPSRVSGRVTSIWRVSKRDASTSSGTRVTASAATIWWSVAHSARRMSEPSLPKAPARTTFIYLTSFGPAAWSMRVPHRKQAMDSVLVSWATQCMELESSNFAPR